MLFYDLAEPSAKQFRFASLYHIRYKKSKGPHRYTLYGIIMKVEEEGKMKKLKELKGVRRSYACFAG